MENQQNTNEASDGRSDLTAVLGVPAIHLAFSDNGEHIRFWTASESHAREWARENWETEQFFSSAKMADAVAKIERLQAKVEKAIHWAEHAMLMRSSQNKELLGILREDTPNGNA